MLEFAGSPSLTVENLPVATEFSDFHPFIKGVFSQWHQTPFNLADKDFSTAEQWMMYCKSTRFEDRKRAEEILATSDPAIQKRLGALVTPFDQAVWDRWKVEIVYRGNLTKFRQNAGAARQLRQTGGAMLVEANVRDWIWGVGLAIDDPKVALPHEWRGANLLGRILTCVRTDLDA